MGSAALFAKLSEDLACVTAVEFRIGYIIALSVAFGVFNGLWDYLHADDLCSLFRHGETDGACAAVEIGDDLAAVRLGILQSLCIEPFRLKGVDLIKGKGRDLYGIAAHSIADSIASPKGHAAVAEDDVGLFGVDVHDYALYFRKGLRKQSAKGGELA